jgi:DNA polymerase
VPPEVERRLGELLRHHLVLTAPASALFLGQAVGRAVFGADAGAARGRLQPINYQGGILSPVATLHPRWLLQNPARKANAWKDLQLLIGGQNL